MTHVFAFALLLAGLAAPVAAQPGPDEPPPDSKAERQKNNAAKLAGLVNFVKSSCPDARADDEKLKTVVQRLGIDPADLDQGDLFVRAKAYTEVYEKDVPGNCARAHQNFGETGTTIPGLIGRK